MFCAYSSWLYFLALRILIIPDFADFFSFGTFSSKVNILFFILALNQIPYLFFSIFVVISLV